MVCVSGQFSVESYLCGKRPLARSLSSMLRLGEREYMLINVMQKESLKQRRSELLARHWQG